MKKSLFLLPLTALVLSACNSGSNNAPVENSAPVVTSTAYDLQTEVQPASMPSSMSTMPVYQPQPVPQPTYSQPTYNQPTAVSSMASGEFNIPRDSSGKPLYSQMTKGAYTGSSYTVQKGDTMYLIGFISGKGAEEIARLNHLSFPYQLSVGQVLKLK